MVITGEIRFLLIICSIPAIAFAQPDSILTEQKKLPGISYSGAGVQYGFIFAHSQAVQNTKGANPTGVDLVIGRQRNDAAAWDLCRCYPRKGLLISYYDYDRNLLGKSFSAAYFIEPTYKLSRRLFFSFKGASGAAYGTNPYDSLRNPGNQSYSTHLNAYLVLGTGLYYRVASKWWVNAAVHYQHISNGGLREPNKGINWPTASVGIVYQQKSRPYYTGIRSREKYWKEDPVQWDVGIFGIARRSLDENGKSRRLPLVGGVVQASKQVGRISALSAGLEAYRDEELYVQLKKDSIDASAVKSGILLGHDFLLGRIRFTQRLGMYLFDQTPYYDAIYHRWGLMYRLTKRFGFGMNLKVHRHVAEFADVRVTYSFR